MQGVLDHVGQCAREQRAVDGHRRQIGVGTHFDRDPVHEAGAVWLDHLLDQRGHIGRLRPRRGRGGEAGKLGRDLTEQLDLREDRRHAFVEHRRERAAAIEVHPLRVLRRQLDRRQRVLDVVRDLPGHVGPRLQPLRALELASLALEVRGHLVEVLDQPPQFVRGGRRHARVEIAARNPTRRPRQAVHRIGDSFGHPVAERGAEQAEQHEPGQHAPIELVDLLLDLLPPVGHRHGDDPVAPARAHRRRRQLIGKIADLFLTDIGRQPIQQNRAVDVAGRARREQLRREQIARAGRLQPRPVEQIDVLVDGAPDQHHDLIVDRVERGGAALLERRVVLDQTLRRGDRARRRLRGAVEQLRRHVGADEDREDEHRHHRARPEREEQLAVEAGTDLAQQRAAARRRPEAEQTEQGQTGEHRRVQHERQHHQLGEVDEMSHPADYRIAQRVDTAAVAEEINPEGLVVALERRPEAVA